MAITNIRLNNYSTLLNLRPSATPDASLGIATGITQPVIQLQPTNSEIQINNNIPLNINEIFKNGINSNYLNISKNFENLNSNLHSNLTVEVTSNNFIENGSVELQHGNFLNSEAVVSDVAEVIIVDKSKN